MVRKGRHLRWRVRAVPERVWRVFELREEGFAVKRIARNLRISETG
jgi:hypothetical protein